MPELKPYRYAVIRVVPRVDREEFLNAGVIVFSAEKRFLGAKVRLSEEKLHALSPATDAANVRRHLEGIERLCAGDATAGPIAALSRSERFHWLTSPKSAMIQSSPVRVGLAEEPGDVLARLTDELVGQG